MMSRSSVLFFLFLLSHRVFGGDIVINEIMYHPSSENSAEEYIELFNKGSETVALQGWRFSRGVDFTFANPLSLGPGEYLVVAADVAAFRAKYSLVTNVVGGWVGRLSNRHEEIELENAAGDREDIVEFAEEGDWAVRQQAAFPNSMIGWVCCAIQTCQTNPARTGWPVSPNRARRAASIL
jgi:hypothetical protein